MKQSLKIIPGDLFGAFKKRLDKKTIKEFEKMIFLTKA